ncbi:DUF605-domain-containing protein [Teratosphaeria destructans]|uniref:DUF605-domain-containing protein n=1 Tax=Teratosphaeria destructans TaxID=418781 RepID=A0A9W7SRN4_9PEZI|nr:DUF605-domain-containing protein [Teratosphaeria destructans]
MAMPLPAPLNTSDIKRFALRAYQLETLRPVVAYWLQYYILQHILNKQLHVGDEAVGQYAVSLMDKVEAYKAENMANDAISDDVAAKAYIEQFALETLNRGEDAQRENRVTRQTVDTFHAAATFLDLLAVWGPLDAEAAAKSKFAKFHALRIAKAIKAGEDPNASNPVVEEPKPPAREDDEELEQELRELEQRQQNSGAAYRPPTVESAPDSGMPTTPRSVVHGEVPPIGSAPQPDVSPIEAAASPAAERSGSVGGGYFPTLPDTPANDASAPRDEDMVDARQDLSDLTHRPPPPGMDSAHSFYNAAATPTAPPPPSLDSMSLGSDVPQRPAPDYTPAFPPSSLATPNSFPPHAPRHPPEQAAASPPIAPPIHRAFAPQPAQPAGGYRTDDESVMAAQKHAKWAISALNFEDVNTAVKELRIALRSLGAE